MTTDMILFLAVCAASALVAWASTRGASQVSYYEGPVRMPDIGH